MKVKFNKNDETVEHELTPEQSKLYFGENLYSIISNKPTTVNLLESMAARDQLMKVSTPDDNELELSIEEAILLGRGFSKTKTNRAYLYRLLENKYPKP
jgi:hypothetical protein